MIDDDDDLVCCRLVVVQVLVIPSLVLWSHYSGLEALGVLFLHKSLDWNWWS